MYVRCSNCWGVGPPSHERIEFAVVALLIYEAADVGISGTKFGGMVSNISYESITRKPPVLFLKHRHFVTSRLAKGWAALSNVYKNK